MRIKDLIEELIQIDLDYGNLPVNHGVDLDIGVMNDNVEILS